MFVHIFALYAGVGVFQNDSPVMGKENRSRDAIEGREILSKIL